MSRKGKQGERGGVVIRKEEIVEGDHHGGAWKVAYADFVTAMMAFFLLMWLLNATTEDQRRGLADYFTPSNAISHASSGSGKPFGGHTRYDHGELVSERGTQTVRPGLAPSVPDSDDPDSDQPPDALHPATPPPTAGEADREATAVGNADAEVHQEGAKAPGGGQGTIQAQSPSQAAFLANAGQAKQADPHALDDAALRAELDRRERAAFEQAAQQIRDAVRDDPQLADLARQLAIDQTPEGLRIQLLDEDRQPMFATGSAVLNERARMLLHKIGPVLAKLSEPVSIAGHTDAAPYKGEGKTNWELSSERANATRRLLVEAGLQEGRLRSVTGNADRDPLLPADPLAAANRRIAIVVLRSVRVGG
ncbi:flagellar motor protein MotB [Limobrevibacterium gyesilva]|uniref:OmpA family protein n=1 Tax=Limobrevibacterium gyesilva TaxID=2991712 RepID=A0AA41YP20_9PROT|nr:flagellar motor protein MotB [Limobrevibacterium gyesilva]MCW3477084.1 OmpA family protein [Limobrevibacterium gyesilva]